MNFTETLNFFIKQEIEKYKKELNIHDNESVDVLKEKFVNNRFDLNETVHYNAINYLSQLLNGIYTDKILREFKYGLRIHRNHINKHEGLIPSEVLDYVNDNINFPLMENGNAVSHSIQVYTNSKKQLAYIHITEIYRPKNQIKINVILDEWDINVSEFPTKKIYNRLLSTLKSFFKKIKIV